LKPIDRCTGFNTVVLSVDQGLSSARHSFDEGIKNGGLPNVAVEVQKEESKDKMEQVRNEKYVEDIERYRRINGA
jgi:hypothetical protein